jgi:hypothetical protein
VAHPFICRATPARRRHCAGSAPQGLPDVEGPRES